MLSRHALLAALLLNLALLLPGWTLFSSHEQKDSLDLTSSSPSLYLSWVRDQSALEPTWPDQPRFTSDIAFRPVAATDKVLITSSTHDCLTAVDARTGSLSWRFQAEGPVRFAPVVWQDRVFFVSDDGHLYCVAAATGELLWKFRGGPSSRRILGNERLISTWPARGAPALAVEKSGRATIYFAAGIWPFMGIFLYALDAQTGEVRWENSGEGSTFIKQPHQTDAFAGLAPQGGLVVQGDRLLVPGGRSIPACYDRHTGKRLHYRLADVSKLGGGPDLVVAHDLYVNGGGAFELDTGSFLGLVGEPAVAVDSILYSISGSFCRAFDLARRPPPLPLEKDAKGRVKSRKASEDWLGEPLARVKVPRTLTLLAAHGRLYGAGPGVVYALPLPLHSRTHSIVWRMPLEGTPIHLAAHGDQLLVSTREGRLYAFSPTRQKLRHLPLQSTPLPASSPAQLTRLQRILELIPIREGYALLLGTPSPGWIRELTQKTNLRLIVIEPQAVRAATLRTQLADAGIDGKRVTVVRQPLAEAQLPPYLAELVICAEDSELTMDASFFEALYSTLRPYGGVAALCLTASQNQALRDWQSHRSQDPQLHLEPGDEFVLLRRQGPLPGAADWTHQHADAANTRVSRDSRVKAPLGLLWFGGPGNQNILPRHGHGPVPQVCQGRLFIEGPDLLRALDIYTGRLLWETILPGVGAIYDNLAHQPGANAAGSNYVSTPQGIFVAYRDRCLKLDPATGKLVQHYQLPGPDGKTPLPWTFLSVAGDYLLGGADPVLPPLPKDANKKPKKPLTSPLASKRLTVLDLRSGKPVFSITARHGFRHNSICIGNGLLYAIDLPAVAEQKKATLAKRASSARLVAYELATGKLVWQRDRGVFGTWLSYSEKEDVLVEAGLMSRDTLADEPEGMRAYRGKSGQVLWYRPEYFGPALIHGQRILKGGDARAGSGTACELLTGNPVQIHDPLTGELMEWKWVRTYGCNTPAASEHLVLFRSGSAGYFDLCSDSGTGNLGGFRSSCTLNLIAAGGVLTVPDYTRTCTCSYQNQCSVGLIHLPEVEMWTFTTSRVVQAPIQRLGLNLGAPGARKADNGTLWLEYPAVGGPSPKVSLQMTPAHPETFRLHSSQVDGDGLRWVAASGVRGLRTLRLSLAKKPTPARYTVRLYFLEPDQALTGPRLFDVSVQGKPILQRLNVSQRAGGAGRVFVHECPEVLVDRDLTISLEPCRDSAVPETLLSGIEILAHQPAISKR